jgi:hypothetical protein
MQIIKCWDIQVWDGGERHYHRYYVKTKEAAEAWKKRTSLMKSMKQNLSSSTT